MSKSKRPPLPARPTPPAHCSMHRTHALSASVSIAWVAKAGLLQIEQAAEAADLAVGARPRGAAGERRDGAHQSLAGVDVDPRLAIPASVGRLQRLLCHEVGLG
jgi:hypothetical protein